jgi:hypothetical protein
MYQMLVRVNSINWIFEAQSLQQDVAYLDCVPYLPVAANQEFFIQSSLNQRFVFIFNKIERFLTYMQMHFLHTLWEIEGRREWKCSHSLDELHGRRVEGSQLWKNLKSQEDTLLKEQSK